MKAGPGIVRSVLPGLGSRLLPFADAATGDLSGRVIQSEPAYDLTVDLKIVTAGGASVEPIRLTGATSAMIVKNGEQIEGDSIRCPYHGWLFAADGRCLDQPCEPDRGRNRESYRQPWYPVVEYHGLIFAYLGPSEKQPVFPRYDIFEDLDAETEEIVIIDHFAFVGPTDAPCNWFQTHENVMDPYHVFILHVAISGPQFDPRLEIWPRIDWQRHETGVTATQDRELPDGTIESLLEAATMAANED